MRLAQISSRAANLAWGPWEIKTKMLSDALGHHACLVQPVCQTRVPAPGCVLVVSLWFLTGQLFHK